jgi:class 3 adenylate cyclase/tetratricopeptide (TPR) repeat protein
METQDVEALPGDAWVLALTSSASQLTCFLSDTRARFEHAFASWPPSAATALPPAIVAALSQSAPAALRLQLDGNLDGWPWEEELERACPRLCVSRHVGKMDPGGGGAPGDTASAVETLRTASRNDPCWIHGPAAEWTARAWNAQVKGKAFVALSDEVPASQARQFRELLNRQWGPQPWLSAAATSAAAQAELPRRHWRLYGDASFSPAAPAGDAEWRQVTSLSTDLIQSTGLLQEWGAERYAQNHAAFHQLCRRVVEEHQGRLDNPQGDDGLMAYFGLHAQEDAAAQGVRAAWALVGQVPQTGFSLRIGITTGRVAVTDGQPFGAVIHLAARLQRLAAPNGILISDKTHALLGPGVVCEKLPQPLQLPGFADPQVAYRVLRLPAPQAAKWQRSGQGHFVGRRQELSLLQTAWALARDRGQGQYECLVGEPGIGKTRLLQEFQRELRAASDAATVVSVAGHQELQSSAFAALNMALEEAALQGLAALLQAATPAQGDAPSGARHAEREDLLDALVAGFLDLARRAPLCFIVDDAQWLDPSTIDFVQQLRAASASVPLLLVVSLREESRNLIRGLDTQQAIALSGLALNESIDLIGSLTAAAPLTADVRSFIAGRAGGIPLFLEETVRMVRQLERDPLSLVKAIPATLEDLLTTRLDGLGGGKPLAQLAAVLGSEFPVSLWEEVLDEPDDWIQRVRVPDATPRLVDGGVLTLLPPDAQRCRFKHALIRDAAYESLWVRDRKRLHAVVARVLKRHSGPASAELLAYHLESAGDLDAAFAAWAVAARAAAASGADREALALAQRALSLLQELPDTPELRHQALQLHLLQAARSIALDGYGAESVELAYLRAAALCNEAESASTRIRVDLGLEACYAMRGDLVRARSLAETAVRNTPWEGNLRLALQARWAWTNVVFHQGDLVSSLDMAEQCLARYEPALHQRGAVQDPAVMFLCYGAWGMFQRGDADEARSRIGRALALAQTLDHQFSLAVAHGFAASVALFCGDYAKGLEHAEEAIQRCSAKTFHAWLAHAQIMRGRLRAALGDPQAGLDDMEEGLALWTGTGARITVATYMAFQAEAWVQIGQPDVALQKVSLAQEIAQRHGEHYYEAELLRLRGWAQWQLRGNADDAAAALALLGDGLSLARRQRNLGFALRSAMALGQAWAELGRRDHAAILLEEAMKAVPGHHTTSDMRAAHALHRRWLASDKASEPERG